MPDDNLKRLYDNVSQKYDLPDFETFKTDMSNETNLKKFYGNVSKDYDLPDYDTFSSDMGLKKKDISSNGLRNITQDIAGGSPQESTLKSSEQKVTTKSQSGLTEVSGSDLTLNALELPQNVAIKENLPPEEQKYKQGISTLYSQYNELKKHISENPTDINNPVYQKQVVDMVKQYGKEFGFEKLEKQVPLNVVDLSKQFLGTEPKVAGKESDKIDISGKVKEFEDKQGSLLFGGLAMVNQGITGIIRDAETLLTEGVNLGKYILTGKEPVNESDKPNKTITDLISKDIFKLPQVSEVVPKTGVKGWVGGLEERGAPLITLIGEIALMKKMGVVPETNLVTPIYSAGVKGVVNAIPEIVPAVTLSNIANKSRELQDKDISYTDKLKGMGLAGVDGAISGFQLYSLGMMAEGVGSAVQELTKSPLSGAGASALVNALGFTAIGVDKQLAETGQVNLKEAGYDFAIGGLLSAPTLAKLAVQKGVQSYLSAPTELTDQVFKSPLSTEKYRQLGVYYGQKAQTETDNNLKDTYTTISQLAHTAADIKGTAKMVMDEPQSYIDAINKSALTESQKKYFIDKIKYESYNLNPKYEVARANEPKIADNNEKIKQIQADEFKGEATKNAEVKILETENKELNNDIQKSLTDYEKAQQAPAVTEAPKTTPVEGAEGKNVAVAEEEKIGERDNWTIEDYKKELKAIESKEGKSPTYIKIFNEFGKKLMSDVFFKKPTQGEQKQETGEPGLIEEAINKLDNEENYTFGDFVDDIDAISVEHPMESKLQDAVKKYREEVEYDRELKGRGDMQTAQDNFLAEINKINIGEQKDVTVQKQTTDESLLRQERPELELQGLGKGNEKPEIVAEKSPEEKVTQAVQDNTPIKSDWGETLWDGKKLTPLGEHIKNTVPKEQIEILTSGKGTPELRKQIADELGITDSQIKTDLTPEQKAENVNEGDLFLDNLDKNLKAVEKTGAETIKVETVKLKENEKEQKSNVEDIAGNKKEKIKFIRERKPSRKIKNPEYKQALGVDSTDPEDMALQYFIAGNKVTRKALESFFSKKPKEIGKKIGITNNTEGLSIDGIAHRLWETQTEEGQSMFSTADFKDAIENVLLGHNGTKSMVEYLNGKHDLQNEPSDMDDYRDYEPEEVDDAASIYDSYTQKELDKIEADITSPAYLQQQVDKYFAEQQPEKSVGQVKAEKEYQQELSDVESKLADAEKAKQAKLNQLNKKIDLFPETKEVKGGVIQQGEDQSSKNLQNILKPFDDKINDLTKQRDDLVKSKEKYLQKYDKQLEMFGEPEPISQPEVAPEKKVDLSEKEKNLEEIAKQKTKDFLDKLTEQFGGKLNILSDSERNTLSKAMWDMLKAHADVLGVKVEKAIDSFRGVLDDKFGRFFDENKDEILGFGKRDQTPEELLKPKPEKEEPELGDKLNNSIDAQIVNDDLNVPILTGVNRKTLDAEITDEAVKAAYGELRAKNEQIFDKVKRYINNNNPAYSLDSVVGRLNSGNATPEDISALKIYKVMNSINEKESYAQYKEAEKNGDNQGMANARIAMQANKNDFYRIYEAARIGRQEWHLIGKAFQGLVDQDFSLQKMKRDTEVLIGRELTKGENKDIEKIYDSHEKLKSDYEKLLEEKKKLENDINERIAKERANIEFKKSSKNKKDLLNPIEKKQKVSRLLDIIGSHAEYFASKTGIIQTLSDVEKPEFNKDLKEAAGLIKDLVTDEIKRGAKTLQNAIDNVFDILNGKVDRKIIRDSFSGYELEKQQKESLPEIKKKINDFKKQAFLISESEDAEKGLTRTKTKIDKYISEETKKLKKERDKLVSIVEKPKKIQDRIDAINQQIEDIENGNIPEKMQRERYQMDARVRAAKNKLYEVMKENGIDPKSETANKSLKTRFENQEAEYRRKIKEGDISPITKPRVPVELQPEVLQARLNRDNARDEYYRYLAKKNWENQSTLDKTIEKIVSINRGMILLNATVYVKLANAAFQTLAMNPIRFAGMELVSRLPSFRTIAKETPIEARLSLKGLGIAYKRLNPFKGQVWKDAMKAFHDRNQGQFEPTKKYIPMLLPDYIGASHGFIKYPIKEAWKQYAIQSEVERYAKNGIPILNDVDIINIEARAERFGFDQILMKDAKATSVWYSLMNSIETTGGKYPGDETKGGTTTGKISSGVLRILNPIVKVGSNYTTRALEYTLGLTKPLSHLDIPIKSVYKGVKEGVKEGEIGTHILNNFHAMVDAMPTGQKVKLMRSIGFGSIGALFVGIGMANPQVFNGYDGTDKKRKRGGMMINGKELPNIAEKAMHAFPGYAAAQFGATLTHLFQGYIKKHGQGESLAGATVGALSTMIEREQPFVQNYIRTGKTISNKQYASAVAEMFGNMLIPNEVQRIAEKIDQDDLTVYKFFFGQPKDRKFAKQWEEGFLQTFEEKIPGLRKRVGKTPIQIQQTNPH